MACARLCWWMLRMVRTDCRSAKRLTKRVSLMNLRGGRVAGTVGAHWHIPTAQPILHHARRAAVAMHVLHYPPLTRRDLGIFPFRFLCGTKTQLAWSQTWLRA
jgi:hypothetical protein